MVRLPQRTQQHTEASWPSTILASFGVPARTHTHPPLWRDILPRKRFKISLTPGWANLWWVSCWKKRLFGDQQNGRRNKKQKYFPFFEALDVELHSRRWKRWLIYASWRQFWKRFHPSRKRKQAVLKMAKGDPGVAISDLIYIMFTILCGKGD